MKKSKWTTFEKIDKEIQRNYRPIYLLSITRKIFERILYMFEFSAENNVISHNQSEFKRGDSCINQSLSITDEVHKSFDDELDVRGAFLDISKAFDKLLHKSLLTT